MSYLFHLSILEETMLLQQNSYYINYAATIFESVIILPLPLIRILSKLFFPIVKFLLLSTLFVLFQDCLAFLAFSWKKFPE